MKTARNIAICGAFCALLIAIQYALNAVKGIELVTVFFFTFCFCFGGLYGCAVAVCYTLIRTFLFGFFPNVFLLYIIYYPIFALASGLVGKLLKKSSPKGQLLGSIVAVAFLVILFSAIDCLITPIVYTYTKGAWMAYVVQALPVCAIQCGCAIITTALLFFPLTRTFSRLIGAGGRN